MCIDPTENILQELPYALQNFTIYQFTLILFLETVLI